MFNHPTLGRDAGQVVPLVALLVAVAAAFTLVLTHLGARAAIQARVQAAADAAALAGALDGAIAAAELAAQNGATLELVETVADAEPGRAGSDPAVSVVVGLSDSAASATAQKVSTSRSGTLAPAMETALAAAEHLLGEPVAIVSGYRSPAEQQALWDARHSNPYPVAVPGTSRHEQGLAVDVAIHEVDRLRRVGALVGLCQPLPTTDPVHFELCRTTATR
jgi:uncharacterized protein YcbK (DUF882 family)